MHVTTIVSSSRKITPPSIMSGRGTVLRAHFSLAWLQHQDTPARESKGMLRQVEALVRQYQNKDCVPDCLGL